MLPTLILEWFHDGAWREIGWRASTVNSRDDLRAHGRDLSAAGGRYRLVNLLPGEPHVVEVL